MKHSLARTQRHSSHVDIELLPTGVCFGGLAHVNYLAIYTQFSPTVWDMGGDGQISGVGNDS